MKKPEQWKAGRKEYRSIYFFTVDQYISVIMESANGQTISGFNCVHCAFEHYFRLVSFLSETNLMV